MTDTSVILLDNICGQLGTGIDWSKPENVSTLVGLTRNYISYKLTCSIIWIALSLLFLIIAIVVCKKINKLYKNTSRDLVSNRETLETMMGYTIVAIVITAIIFIIVTTYQAFNIAEYITFPEKAVLDYVKGLQVK